MHPDDEREAITTGRGELPDRDQITYKGWRDQRRSGPVSVYRVIEGESVHDLDPKPSQELWNHSPDGFQWGYGGSGPAQLALALLLDATGASAPAVHWHQRFKFSIVAKWGDTWQITRTEILTWINEQIAEGRRPQP